MSKAVIISGTMETSLHPIPPVADSAPEWNVFRLAEADGKSEIHVISPCEVSQLPAINRFACRGNYHHIIFGRPTLWFCRNVLRFLFPLRLIVRQFATLPDLMSWMYLRRVRNVLSVLSADIVIINARPQYIRYLRPLVQRGRLLLFMRGPLGESREFLKLLDGIIVNSEGMRTYAEQFVDTRLTPVHKIPNSLGDEFQPPLFCKERFTRKDTPVVFAGRIIPEKGVVQLIDAFRIVLKKKPSARLQIYGASDNAKTDGHLSQYERKVRAKAAALPTGSVTFHGYVPHKEMCSRYSQATVAVFPSLQSIYLESFGMVALEAMRCSTPTIVSRQPGFEELITHAETGLLVDDPTNIDELASAMLTVLEDPALANTLAEAGYNRSLDFTPEKARERFDQILQYLLAGSTRNFRHEDRSHRQKEITV